MSWAMRRWRRRRGRCRARRVRCGRMRRRAAARRHRPRARRGDRRAARAGRAAAAAAGARRRAPTCRTRPARRCACRWTARAAGGDARPAGRRGRPRGAPVLVVLSGGPGEPGLPFLERAREWLGPEAAKLRLVAIDQRGTGRTRCGARRCRSAMGASDLTPPPAAAVQRLRGDDRRPAARSSRPPTRSRTSRRCGVALGGAQARARRHLLRHVRRPALRARAPAQRQPAGARLGRPRRGRQPALDRPDPGRPSACWARTTTRDLARSSRSEHNGPQMLDMLTGLSVGAPRGNGAAASARRRRRRQHRPARRPPGRRLAGDAVLDGGAAQPGPAREHAVRRHARAVGRRVGAARGPPAGARARGEAIDDDLYPYDRETATGNGIAQQCLNWPPVDVPKPDGPRDLPDVPVCCWPATATSRRRWSGRGRRRPAPAADRRARHGARTGDRGAGPRAS